MKLLRYTVLAGAVFFLFSCRTVDVSKRFPNMVANADPITVGTVEAQFDKAFSTKLNKVEMEVVFHPRLNAVSLEFRYELVRYWQFWDQAGRQQFTIALEHYKSDYEARKLTTKYHKTKAIYGKVKGRTEWETFRFTKTRVAYPTIELGYRFRSEAPFFATLMRPAREVDDISDNSPNNSSRVDSLLINMYFTRAQAEELVKLFDQSYLMGLLGEYGGTRLIGEIEVDTYDEHGDEPAFSSDVAEEKNDPFIPSDN